MLCAAEGEAAGAGPLRLGTLKKEGRPGMAGQGMMLSLQLAGSTSNYVEESSGESGQATAGSTPSPLFPATDGDHEGEQENQEVSS
jgi:hypothetical protein